MLTKKTAFNNVECVESVQYMLIFKSIMSFSKVKGVDKQYSEYFVFFSRQTNGGGSECIRHSGTEARIGGRAGGSGGFGSDQDGHDQD